MTTTNRFEAYSRSFFLFLIGVFLPAVFVFVDHMLVSRLIWPQIHGIQHIYYHHGYPAYDFEKAGWGSNTTFFYTNSLAMKDSSRREVSRIPVGKRVIFIGDSFTEGVGVSYEDSFVGQFARTQAPAGTEVLNAGVASFSPRLYYLRTRRLLEVEKIKFDELYVFIDISDIQDELGYDGFEPETSPTLLRRARVWLHRNSFTYRLLPRLYHQAVALLQKTDSRMPTLEPGPPKNAMPERAVGVAADPRTLPELRSSWTFLPYLMKLGGQRGLDLATGNMELLFELCKLHGIALSIAVYPWPQQISAHDLNSLQVTHWRKFAQARGINFLNFFPSFIGDPDKTKAVLKTYFNERDVHWNVSGHARIAHGLCAPGINPEAKKFCKRVE